MPHTTDEDKKTPHGLQVSARWEWSTHSDTNRWTAPQQGIKPSRYNLYQDPTIDYDGFGVKVAKLKIRGRGKSVAFRFESEDGKDFIILGWAVPFTSETTP